MEVKMRFGKGQMVSRSTRGNKDGYFPGGTAIVTRGRMTRRIEKRGVDEMGRYSWIILNGKKCKLGMIIGPHTAHMQQVKHLLKRKIIAPNQRKEVLKDLKRLVEEHHSQGGGVVLMMDANEDREKEAN